MLKPATPLPGNVRLVAPTMILGASQSGLRGKQMWLIDFCHKRSAECIEMAESCADTDTERRKAWLELAKQWSRLPEEIVLRKAGAAALVQAMLRSPADEPGAAALVGPAQPAGG